VYQWAKKAGSASGENVGNGICTDKSNNVYVTGYMDSIYQYCKIDTATPIHYAYSFVSKYTPAGQLEWIQKVNGIDNNQGMHVTTDSSANVYVAGIFSEYDTNAWANCIHLTKPYDGMIFNTTHHYDTTFINYTIINGNDTILRDTIRVDTVYYTGNDTIHGTNLNEVYIAKYDSSGYFLWVNKAIGLNSNLTISGITTDNFGNLYIIGGFAGTAKFDNTTIFSNGNGNFYLAKYSVDSGHLEWVRHGGVNGAGVNFSSKTGNINITGIFQDTASFGTTSLTNFGNFNNNNIFVASIDTGGTWAWAVKAGSTADNEVKGIVTDTAGNIFITGYITPGESATFGGNTFTAYPSDLFLAEYDFHLGANLWVKPAGGAIGTGFDDVNGITLDASRNIYLTGDFKDTAIFGNKYYYSLGGYNIFISKYNSSGIILGSQSAIGNSDDIANSIAVDGANGVYITGSFKDSCDFGNTTPNKLYAGIATDIFIAKTGMNVGINEISGKQYSVLNVYPNPSTGAVTVNFYTSENTNMIVRLTNLNGQIIYYAQRKQTAGVFTQTLDFSNQPKGVYFLEVISDNETMVRKLVIE
jgi:hypothetical protein